MSETDESKTAAEPEGQEALALKKVVREIERGVSSLGWDRPPMLYGLVRTETLLNTDGLPEDMRGPLEDSRDGNPAHLSAILQEVQAEEDIEQVLPHIGWPENVDGAALTVERLVVPPEVEDEAPEDPEEALEFISNHPSRTEVRLVVGVDRAGNKYSAIRTRAFDDAANVVEGEDLVPALSGALALGFDPNGDPVAVGEEHLRLPNRKE